MLTLSGFVTLLDVAQDEAIEWILDVDSIEIEGFRSSLVIFSYFSNMSCIIYSIHIDL